MPIQGGASKKMIVLPTLSNAGSSVICDRSSPVPAPDAPEEPDRTPNAERQRLFTRPPEPRPVTFLPARDEALAGQRSQSR